VPVLSPHAEAAWRLAPASRPGSPKLLDHVPGGALPERLRPGGETRKRHGPRSLSRARVGVYTCVYRFFVVLVTDYVVDVAEKLYHLHVRGGG